MSLSAGELASWLRFAERGGIGKGTALCSRPEEGPDDLIFFRDEEITVLCRLADQDGFYFGYCEGNVGRFNGADVRFHSALKRSILTKSLSRVLSDSRSLDSSRSPGPRETLIPAWNPPKVPPSSALLESSKPIFVADQLERNPFLVRSNALRMPIGIAATTRRRESLLLHYRQHQHSPSLTPAFPPPPLAPPAPPQVPVTLVIRQALSQPTTEPSDQIQTIRLPLRGPTIYGWTELNLVAADGPVPINFSVNPPLPLTHFLIKPQVQIELPTVMSPPLDPASSPSPPPIPPLEPKEPLILGKEYQDADSFSLSSFFTITSQTYSSAASFYSCISKPGSIRSPEGETNGRPAYNAYMAALDLATHSMCSLASSRTASTDYGLYYTRRALSQDTMSIQDGESMRSVARRRSWDSFWDSFLDYSL